MGDFVVDTFSGESADVDLTQHIGDIGATWTLVPGYTDSPKVTIQSDCRSVTTSGSAAYASGVPASTEYSITADIIPGGSGHPSLLGRVSTSAPTFYMARFDAVRNLQLYKCVDGAFTLLGEYDGSYSKTLTYLVKLEIKTASKKVFVDGVERISSADNEIAGAGLVGIRFFGSSDTAATIDNFTASDLSTILPINLLADDITSGTPAVGSPALGQTHQLAANDIATGSPVVATPALAEAVDNLTAADLTTGVPAIDVPALGQAHILSGAKIATGAPTVTAPSMSESTNNLTAAGITTPAPDINQPGLGQVHGLTSAGITVGQPAMSAPDLTAVEGVDSLTGTDITTQVPAVTAPDIGQTHALGSADLAAGVPAVDVPAVGQVHGLIGTGIATGQPIVSTPTVAQGAHHLNALDIATGMPIIEAPGLGQVHALISSDVLTGSLFVSAPALDWDAPITPAIRTYSVLAENRIFKIEYENRTFKI